MQWVRPWMEKSKDFSLLPPMGRGACTPAGWCEVGSQLYPETWGDLKDRQFSLIWFLQLWGAVCVVGGNLERVLG